MASIAIEADGRGSIVSAGGIPLCARLAATGTSLVKGHAAWVLSSCCLDADKRLQLLQEGAVAVLVGVACSVAAVAVLSSCAIENKHHSVILAEGGVAAMVHVARMGELPAAGRGDVALALYLLSRTEDCRSAIVQEGGIEVLRQMSRENGSADERLTRKLAIATGSICLQACHPRSPSNSDSD